MAVLKPDNTRTVLIAGKLLTIKEKIIPDKARATKHVASYVKQGDPMKPCAKLNSGKGPKAITVHNTEDINTAAATTPAEQYTRATWPNCNMGGVVVHYYVYKDDIWQNLIDTEQGWHAADGTTRRSDHRGELTGGNLDTIAIECIGDSAESEDTAAALAAHLCREYGLDPYLDVYTHNYWMYGQDKAVTGVMKNCPMYILTHWKSFLEQVQKYYTAAEGEDGLNRVQVGAFKEKAYALAMYGELEADGYSACMVSADGYFKAQVGAFANRSSAENLAAELHKKGYQVFITTKAGKPVSVA